MFKEGDEQALMELWKRQGVVPIVADVSEMETVVPAAFFDCVVALEVIEHFKEPRRLLDNVYRVVKPGGSVVMTTPNYGRLHARLRLLVGKNPKVDLETFYLLGERGFIGHWREYLPYELEEMFRLANFTSVRTHTFCDPWHIIRKGVSSYSLKQTLQHLLSHLIPQGRYQCLVVGRKKRL
jgi:SAM-dependent methyltransferase